jgi:hypothetical protein
VILVIARVWSPVGRLDGRELQELVRLAEVPGDRLEHLYVDIRPDGAELVFFMAQPTAETAKIAVERLCRQAFSRSEMLRDCALGDHFVGLVPGVDFVLFRDQAGAVRLLPPQDPDSSNH